MTNEELIGRELARSLALVHNRAERSAQSFLEVRVDAFIGVRFDSEQTVREGLHVRMFYFEVVPLVVAVDDIRTKPHYFEVPWSVDLSIRLGTYDFYYVRLGKEVFQLPVLDFKQLYFASTLRIVKDPVEVDYFCV